MQTRNLYNKIIVIKIAKESGYEKKQSNKKTFVLFISSIVDVFTGNTWGVSGGSTEKSNCQL